MALSAEKRQVNEETTPLYQFFLRGYDELGAEIPVGQNELTAMTLTYYDMKTGQVINSRNNQNVLNANNVSVDDAGMVLWLLQPEDTTIVSTEKGTDTIESHRGMFQFDWDLLGRSYRGRHEVQVDVLQMAKVPVS